MLWGNLSATCLETILDKDDKFFHLHYYADDGPFSSHLQAEGWSSIPVQKFSKNFLDSKDF
jgi:hypothetical protein